MSSLFSNLLADITTLPWVAIIAVAGGMLITIVVIIGGLIIAYHRQRQWHETARLALEKGQPLPASQDEAPAPQPRADESSRDLRAGLILIATGAGLYVFFDALLGKFMAYIGAIPGFIGVALVLYAFIHAIFKGKPANPEINAAAHEAAPRVISKVGKDTPPADRS